MTANTEERKIDRLDRFAQFRNLNDNRITQECGLSIGTLGKSRKPGKDISRKTTEAILERYPEIDREWFVTGIGDMLANQRKPEYPAYPYFDTDTAECGPAAGMADGIVTERLPRVAIPGVPRDTEFFIKARGYSMLDSERPELSIPPGALVGLAKVSAGVIRWGETYALTTDDGIIIKRVLPDPDDSRLIRCVSYNREDFPEFAMPRADVREFARITCVVPVYVR